MKRQIFQFRPSQRQTLQIRIIIQRIILRIYTIWKHHILSLQRLSIMSIYYVDDTCEYRIYNYSTLGGQAHVTYQRNPTPKTNEDVAFSTWQRKGLQRLWHDSSTTQPQQKNNDCTSSTKWFTCLRQQQSRGACRTSSSGSNIIKPSN